MPARFVSSVYGLCLLTLLGCAAGSTARRGDGGVVSDGGSSADSGRDATGDARADAAPAECGDELPCIDDGIFCNGNVECFEGRCRATAIPSCDDTITCTRDYCDTVSDLCAHETRDSRCPVDLRCSDTLGCVAPSACEFDTDCKSGDGLFCNGDEVCSVDLMCTSPGTRDCGDANNCTADTCVEERQSCMSVLADYLNDPDNCGPTGENDCGVCPEPSVDRAHTARLCALGSCGFACVTGFADADRNEANGCECAIGAGTDEPDGDFEDSDCDGIDGDLEQGILVALSGADNDTCGIAFDAPCRTLAHAMDRGDATDRHDLFVQAGTYSEGTVVLRDTFRMFGGYDTEWVRASRASTGHQTRIRGGLYGVDGQYVALVLRNLATGATVENLTIEGPNAVGSDLSGYGLGSYGINVSGSRNIRLIRLSVEAGDGADGRRGSGGSAASAVDAASGMNGRIGGDASEFASAACNRTDHGAGGAAGTNSCAGGRVPTGGGGGAGGEKDTNCAVFSLDYDATAGDNGASASSFVSGSFGFRGAGGAGTMTCGAGGGGNDGRVTNGSGGSGGTGPTGTLASRYWRAAAGGAGAIGDHGGGGGGGGGSGGCDTGTDSWGAGGGGGAAGGCRARSGGSGGGGGGGSIGIIVTETSGLTFTECTIVGGAGGDGGDGGAGARGQSGGDGGAGGHADGDSRAGGDGGDGGHGGHSGGGGGGAGGSAVGVILYRATSVTGSCSFAGGAGGRGGDGGAAASAPVGERDGFAGVGGVDGTASGTRTCSSTSC